MVEETFRFVKDKKNSSLYARSKFYIALRQIKVNLTAGKMKGGKLNPYYNPSFEEKILKKVCIDLIFNM